MLNKMQMRVSTLFAKPTGRCTFDAGRRPEDPLNVSALKCWSRKCAIIIRGKVSDRKGLRFHRTP